MTTAAAENPPNFSRAQHRLRAYAGSVLVRLRMQAALDALAVVTTASFWLLAFLIFADKLFSLSTLGINVWVIWGGVSLLGIPFLLWRTFARGLHERRAAVLADERLGLHARLSSALTLDFSDPNNAPFGDAFYGEALRRMAAVRVQQAFKIRVPRLFALLLIPALLAAGVFYLMPRQDVLGIAAKAEAKRKADERKQDAAKTLEGRLLDLKLTKEDKASDEAGKTFKVSQLVKDAQQVAKDLKDGKKDADEAVQMLGEIKKQVEDEKDKIQHGNEFSSRLEKLKAEDLNLADGDQTRAISEALKNGDSGLAAQEMRKLASKVKDILNDNTKTDEQKRKELEKLNREMEKLAGALADDAALHDKLEEISRTSMSAADFQKLSEEMKKQEEKQGKRSNKKFGDDIENELEQAADETERLTEEDDTKLNDDEKEEVKELDEVEDGVDEAMQNLAGEGQGKDGQSKDGQVQGGKKAGGQTGKGAGKQSGANGKMKSMSGKSGRQRGQSGQSGQNGSGQGSGDKGDKGQNQSGRPGDGLGSGTGMGRRPYQDGENSFEAQKAKGEMRAGAITGISHFRGQGAKGDAPQEFYKTFEPENKDGASSLELERIPADARDMVKDYFSRVREGAGMPTAPAPNAPAPKQPDAPKQESLKE